MRASADDVSASGFAYRFAWGVDGLLALAPICDVIVVIDVLRFTSAVSVAVDAGATVFPFRWKDGRAASYAAERQAQLAGPREDGGPSLSPTDTIHVPPSTRIVLPSPMVRRSRSRPRSTACPSCSPVRCATPRPRPGEHWPSPARARSV